MNLHPEENSYNAGVNSIVTFQNSQNDADESQIMVDIHPSVPYKDINQTYITQSSQFIDNSDKVQIEDINQKTNSKIKIKKKKKKKKSKKNIKNNCNYDNNIINSDIKENMSFPPNFSSNPIEKDICPNTPVEDLEPNEKRSNSVLDSSDVYIKKFDATNPSHIFSSLSIVNNEKLKKEISANLRVQQIKEKRKQEEEARFQKFEEEESKIKARLSALQQQQLQKIVKNHEYYRAKSQKALKQRQILEEMKLKTAESAMLRIETVEKRKLQIQQAKHEAAMQKSADEWLKRHFAQQAMLQMERRKQKQLKILAEKDKESTIRVQKMKSEMMKKEQTRRTVMKKYYASVPS